MYLSFLEFRAKEPLLSIADRSTLALAHHNLLLCASDDGLVIKVCQEYQITYTRTLRLLTEMVKTQHKTIPEVKEMANMLVDKNKRGKNISKKVFNNWYKHLREL